MADLSTLTGGFSLASIQSSISDIGKYVLWGVLGLAFIIFAYMKYQDKKIYIYPVRINKQRHNGQVKEQNTFGGYVKKGSVTQFMVKMTRFKKKAMDKLPDSSLMDEDNRVHYWQVSPESPFIQVKRDFKIEQLLVPNEKYIEPTEESIEEEIEFRIKNKINEYISEEELKTLKPEEVKEFIRGIILQEIQQDKNRLIDVTIPTYTPVPTDLKQSIFNDIAIYKSTLGVDTNKQMAYFVFGVIALIILGIVVFYIAVNKGDVPILTK